jgi:pimeloyl-ACP methyl ester carboxylesterase
VKATIDWRTASGSAFLPHEGTVGHAQLKHYTARYAEWGEGPPLILVPGLAGGYELLGPLARLLAEHFHVISYQLRGEDEPFALRRRFDLKALSDDLAELTSWLGLERPAVMGVSFGGLVALDFATRHPGRLGQLIVQGVGARFEKTLFRLIAGWALTCLPLPTDSAFVNQFFNLLFGGRERPLPLFDFVTRQCWTTDQSVMAHRFRLAEKFRIQERLSRIRVPSLLLAGDRDLLVTEDSLKTLHEGIRDAQLVKLEGCGHLAFATQPQRVVDEVRRFHAHPASVNKCRP